jgi:glycosyltransferase involved in cell wall biosynthesis
MADLLVVGGVSAERIQVAPIGYDALEDVTREPSALAAALPLAERFVVLYSGTMGYVVDVETMLESARLTRDRADILYLFVGDGQRLIEYQERSRRDGSQLRLHGVASRSTSSPRSVGARTSASTR